MDKKSPTWRYVDPTKVYFETRGHKIVKVVEATPDGPEVHSLPVDEPTVVDMHAFNPDARDPE
jgi:hypothetical protein